MDFWARLTGGTALTSSRALRKNTTGKRLAAFKQTSNTLYQIWRNSPTLTPDTLSIPHIRNSLDRLNAILSDESRGPSPHSCHTYAATSQVYLTVTKLALATNNPGVIASTARLLNTLIEAEVDGIVDSRTFSRALVELVSSANSNVEGEAKLVELAFGVSNIIRLRTEVLPAWFFPKATKTNEDEGEGQGRGQEQQDAAGSMPVGGKEFAGATRRDDFPLFYLLIDFVHCEGRTGDFARTGLLYIIETASKAKDLEKWLIESDMATLMATGLGASYSQLSSLLITTESHDIPHIVALSDHENVESGVHQDLGVQMDAFLSYLLFWQDAIDHCKSPEVNDTLLDHFQILFLEQLLYPSLLESSDVDGGTTSSVITYLCRILESIHHPDLVHRILHFLLASPSRDEPQVEFHPPKSRMSMSRRKSLDILASFAEAAAKPSPTLFNLVDLVLMGIGSKNRQTVVATLRLINVIVQYHHQFTSSLIKTVGERGTETKLRTISALNSELQQLLCMATTILDSPTVDQSYGEYSTSASSILYHRTHTLSLTHEKDPFPESPWILDVNDGIFTGIVDLLRHFFSNSVLTNLALTNAIAALASSDLISLDGWLLVHPEHHQPTISSQDDTNGDPVLPSQSPDNTEESDQFKPSPEQPSWLRDHSPILLETLSQLVSQIEAWREEIPDFDTLLDARRRVLHCEDETEPPEPVQTHTQSTKLDKKLSLDQLDDKINKPGSSSALPRGRTLSQLPDRSKSATPTTVNTVGTIPESSPGPSSPSPSRPQSKSRPSQQSPPSKDLRRQAVTNPGSSHIDTTSVGSSTPNNPTTATTASSIAGSAAEDVQNDENRDKASVNHILTNAVILYEFILEISALVQVRASVLQDVRFTV